MNKQVVIFVNLTELYNILYEIKNFISFDIKNYANKDDFFQDLNKNNILTESTIVTCPPKGTLFAITTLFPI